MSKTKATKKKKCGFHVMTPEQRTKIARKGGKAIVKRFGAGYMAELGRRGGTAQKGIAA